jgi:hypothetical protein
MYCRWRNRQIAEKKILKKISQNISRIHQYFTNFRVHNTSILLKLSFKNKDTFIRACFCFCTVVITRIFVFRFNSIGPGTWISTLRFIGRPHSYYSTLTTSSHFKYTAYNLCIQKIALDTVIKLK